MNRTYRHILPANSRAKYSVLGGRQFCASSDWLMVSLRRSPSGSLLAQPATRSIPVRSIKQNLFAISNFFVVIIPKSSDLLPAESRLMSHARSAWWL